MKNRDSNTYQAMWVGIGSVSSFAFTIISAAILSRFLSKTEYGTYKQVMYVYNTLLVVFTLGLPKAYAYFLPRFDVKYGFSIVSKLNKIFFFIGLIFSLLLFGGSKLISDVLQNSQLSISLKLFAISPTFILPTMGLDGIMSVYKKNYINAIYTVTTRLLMLLCVVLPVFFYRADSCSAIAGFSLSSFFTFIIGLYLKRVPFKGIVSEKSLLSYREIFCFSVPLMLASLGAIAIKSADQFYVSRYFGTDVFADFSNGSLDLPFVGMVLGAAATVLLPEFSRNLSKGEASYASILDLWRRTAVKSALVLYPLIVFCIFYSKDIMILLYGEQYHSSAIYFCIILIVDLFTIAPYYPIIIAFGASKYYAKVHIWLALLVWLSEYFVVQVFYTPLSIAIISAIFHLIKILIMANYIASRLKIQPYKLFPLNSMVKILIVNFLGGCFVFVLHNTILRIDIILLRLLSSFTLYAIIVLVIGRFLNVDFLTSFRPIIYKFKNDKTED